MTGPEGPRSGMYHACLGFLRGAEYANFAQVHEQNSPITKLPSYAEMQDLIYLTRLISYGAGYAEACGASKDWLKIADMAIAKGNSATARYVQSVLVGENDSV